MADPAAVLYGAPPADAAPAPPAAPTPEDELARRMFAPRPEPLPQRTGDSVADRMWIEPALRERAEATVARREALADDLLGRPGVDVLAARQSRDVAPAAFDSVDVAAALDPDLPEPVRTAVAREARELAADLGATTDELTAALAAGREVAGMADEDRAVLRTQALQALVDQHGDRAQALLDQARAAVAASPQLHKIMAAGLGDHPRVVLAVVDAVERQARARRLRGAGR